MHMLYCRRPVLTELDQLKGVSTCEAVRRRETNSHALLPPGADRYTALRRSDRAGRFSD